MSNYDQNMQNNLDYAEYKLKEAERNWGNAKKKLDNVESQLSEKTRSLDLYDKTQAINWLSTALIENKLDDTNKEKFNTLRQANITQNLFASSALDDQAEDQTQLAFEEKINTLKNSQKEIPVLKESIGILENALDETKPPPLDAETYKALHGNLSETDSAKKQAYGFDLLKNSRQQNKTALENINQEISNKTRELDSLQPSQKSGMFKIFSKFKKNPNKERINSLNSELKQLNVEKTVYEKTLPDTEKRYNDEKTKIEDGLKEKQKTLKEHEDNITSQHLQGLAALSQYDENKELKNAEMLKKLSEKREQAQEEVDKLEKEYNETQDRVNNLKYNANKQPSIRSLRGLAFPLFFLFRKINEYLQRRQRIKKLAKNPPPRPPDVKTAEASTYDKVEESSLSIEAISLSDAPLHAAEIEQPQIEEEENLLVQQTQTPLQQIIDNIPSTVLLEDKDTNEIESTERYIQYFKRKAEPLKEELQEKRDLLSKKPQKRSDRKKLESDIGRLERSIERCERDQKKYEEKLNTFNGRIEEHCDAIWKGVQYINAQEDNSAFDAVTESDLIGIKSSCTELAESLETLSSGEPPTVTLGGETISVDEAKAAIDKAGQTVEAYQEETLKEQLNSEEEAPKMGGGH